MGVARDDEVVCPNEDLASLFELGNLHTSFSFTVSRPSLRFRVVVFSRSIASYGCGSCTSARRCASNDSRAYVSFYGYVTTTGGLRVRVGVENGYLYIYDCYKRGL